MPAAPPSSLVVVGFAEALAAPECVWSLVDAGFSVVAFTRTGSASALAHSRHVRLHPIPAPESDLAGAQAALWELLDRLRRDPAFAAHVLMPLDDTAVCLCGRVEADRGWALAGPAPDSGLALTLNKRLQTEAARASGFDLPATQVVSTLQDLDQLAPEFPLILRSADAVRAHGNRLRKGRNWICSDAEELAAARIAWSGNGSLLVQPYVEGTGEGIFGLRTARGIVAWSAHRRLRMMNPHGSGSSACVSRRVDESLRDPISRLLGGANWSGLFMIELLRGTDGRTLFVEFNGRAWGSMALARRQGFEYPAWAALLALGEPMIAPEAAVAQEGLICRNLGRELMHLLFVLRGRRSRAMRAWPSFATALTDVLRPQRNSTFYNWRRGDWRVFASDCYYTLVHHLRKQS